LFQGGIAPLQFRTKGVFGCPAQIHVRKTIRDDNKLSDRSISGTFIGHSTTGNGYIFLISKKAKFTEIDSKDANLMKYLHNGGNEEEN
jgi:hypothetical protein